MVMMGSAPILTSAAITEAVKISGVRTGWNADQVAVTITGAIPNPARCSQPDGFILSPSTPGYKTHYATILTAFAMNKDVQIIVADTGCASNRPVFWGINIL